MRHVIFIAVCSSFALAAPGCAHSGSDPLPPRAKRAGPPEFVKDHPGFVKDTEVPSLPASAPADAALCERQCPEGQRCEVVQGVDRCVPNDP